MNRHIISENSTILDALKVLNSLSGQPMVLIAVNDSGVVKGTLTDGDIRRALLAGASTDTMVSEVMFREFKHLRDDIIDVKTMKQYRQMGIKLLPHIAEDGTIKQLYDLTVTRTILPLSAILMAGGKGERLRPLTLNTPKPLLEIGGKAIIDYNIEALSSVGINDITVTTRYLAEQIHKHFATPIAGVKVKCVTETQPLGTIGAASLVPRDKEGNTLVMNSDLLTTISFEEMYMRHIEEQADVTIAAIPYVVSVPYAILTTDGVTVNGIEEKPSYSYYANAGIYIFSNKLLDTVPSDSRTDATDLIEQAIDKGLKVVYYPINGTWIDVGSPNDFKQAQDLMRHHNDLIK
ncbi:MAG: NTP transferase domain-containing protein [Muribaculaceae bacterium]|nr:NTP transferase domain-containing protein [Muribaculaceae bacterium]